MDQWDDLLLSGGFAPRQVLLRGLTTTEVAARPDGVAHSIYQELWHATQVLAMSMDKGRVSLETWPYDEHFPAATGPASESEWAELVAEFLRVSQRAVELSHEEGWLESPDPGYESIGSTWRDALEFLAVHTAYHLGKIVTLRQLLGSWPPPKAPA